ncbi:MAG: ABC transporter permease, partial [Acidilobaceae archaeon]
MVFVKNLQKQGGVVYRDFATDLLQQYNSVVFIPQNFSFPANVEVWSYRGLLSHRLPAVERAARETAEEVGIPPQLIVEKYYYIYLNGAALTKLDINLVTSAFSPVWILALLILSMTSTIVSASVGVEREKKTFELILSTPASAKSIVVAKLVSSTIVALIELVALGIGMLFLLSSIMHTVDTTIVDSNFETSPEVPSAITLSIASVFPLSIISLAISFLIASRAEDVKTATSIAPSIVMFLMFPLIMTFFIPLDVMEHYPFAHPVVVMLYALLGQFEKAYFYIALDWIMALVVLFITFKIATPEYLLGKFK